MSVLTNHQRTRVELIESIPVFSRCGYRCSTCAKGPCCLDSSPSKIVGAPEGEAGADDLNITVSGEAEPGEEEVD